MFYLYEIFSFLKSYKYLFNSSNLKHIIYAFLLFIPSLVWFNENYFLLLPIAILLIERNQVGKELFDLEALKKNKTIIILITAYLGLSYANKLSFGLPINCLKDYYASFLLFPILIFISLHIKNLQFAKYFIALTCLEVIFCLAEYYSGTRTFFLNNYPPIDKTSDFIYDYRVFGLSVNSSVVSFKIFAAILLIESLKIPKSIYYSVLSLLFIGSIITFNRALILAILFFYFIITLSSIWRHRSAIKKSLTSPIPLLIFLAIFQLFAKHFFLTELNKNKPEKNKLEAVAFKSYVKSSSRLTCSSELQPKMKEGSELNKNLFLTGLLIKNTKNVNTSGRTLIWANYFQFIQENLWFGNGSDKLYFREKDPNTGAEKLVHAHNSFIEIIASNGLILTALFLSILFLIWKKKNIIFLLTILFFSFFQYGIFWGISILDVVFMIFVLSPIQLYHENK